MRVIIQRSKESNVVIDNKVHGSINKGYVLLVSFTNGDDEVVVDKVINKIINLRLFEDENGKTNLSLKDVEGEILSISQFTLYADVSHGRRPSFINSLEASRASELYDYFNSKLESEDITVQKGIFGADMTLNIKNDGPFTIILDSNML